jgi:hypothetical protein
MPGRTSLHPLRRAAAVLALAAAWLVAGAAHADQPASPAQVARRKALFIEQFTRLIEWPADKLPRDGRFVLCLLGTSDTAAELSKLAASRRFKDRMVDVRALPPGAPPADLAACHLIYLAGSAAPRLPRLLEAVAGKPILTVSDTAGFVERGVHFNLFEETRGAPQQGRFVNFEVNVPAVKRSVLAFDAQLLSHARKVDAPTPPPSKESRP